MPLLKVVVEKIIYHNTESNYLVARCCLCEKEEEYLTIVGNLVNPAPGIILQIEGDWTHHPRYGKQFKFHTYTKIEPATEEGIEKYLASGIIEKIGPGIARRIVKHFGKDTIKIIEKEPERLKEVEGVGARRKENIIAAWEKEKKAKEIMLFLYSLGIGTSTVNKIYAAYQDEAIQKIKENPYRLIEDIFGVGFKKADLIAEYMGIEKNSPLRIKAGIHHILLQSTEQGHTFLPYDEVISKVCDLLKIERENIEKFILELNQKKEIYIEENAVYHPQLYLAEIEVARRLGEIKKEKIPLPLGWEMVLDVLQKEEEIKLSPGQKEAIEKALNEKLMVLTGGPGTGKTTTVRIIARIFEELGFKVLLAAPTGRAAKRLAEATGKNASTIHRLLGFAPGIGFTKNQKNKLRADVVIVDEVSMVDILLANALLRALPSSCRLIFVGDADQLPAVGPGNFLQDMIQSQNIPVVKLKEIFRQAKKSLIVVNAHRINQGKFPLLSAPSKTCEFSSQEKDFYFIEEKDAEKVEKIVISLCCKELPKKFGFDPFSDIQVISPLYKGQAGVTRLNRILQEILNPSGKAFKRGQMVFKEGDKVMQLKNNYEKEVFNGDIGTIKKVDEEEKVIEVNFPEKDVLYQDDDLNQLTLAYAISVHKSQGSEYPVVIMPVIMSHYIMLQRNLIYTALTRAKKRVFLVGEKRALTIAIKNDRIAKRFTKLAERLLAEN